MSAHPLPQCTPTLDSKLPPLSYPSRRLSTVGCELRLLLNIFPIARTSSSEPKSFIRNAYKKHGGVGDASGTANLGCPSYLSFGLQVSTINFQPLPPVTSRGLRTTDHGSRLHEPAHL